MNQEDLELAKRLAENFGGNGLTQNQQIIRASEIIAESRRPRRVESTDEVYARLFPGDPYERQ